MHTDNRKKDILVLGEELTDGLDNISKMVEAKYSVNIAKSRKEICLIQQCNAASSFSYASDTKVIASKISEIKSCPLCS